MITINEILKNKYEEVENLKKVNCKRNRKIYKLSDFIKEKPFIAEIKKKSPSKGIINNDIDIVDYAVKYEQFGAGAISVLTDETFFNGNIEDLYEISKNVKLPILCKDFTVSKLQILNAHISGADIVLLIVSILDDSKLEELSNYAKKLELDIIFEIHSFDDFQRIKRFNPEFVGVNSRNFYNMKIEKERAIQLLKKIEGDFIKIAESGINSGTDIKDYRKSGADAFLIGTSLMSAESLKNKFQEFYSCL